jgi:hypothetical protein
VIAGLLMLVAQVLRNHHPELKHSLPKHKRLPQESKSMALGSLVSLRLVTALQISS